MIVQEKELNKIIRKSFYLKDICLEIDGILYGKIYFKKAECKYRYKIGILIIFDIVNLLKVDLSSEYEIIFNKKEKSLIIKLDNGQDIKILEFKSKQ